MMQDGDWTLGSDDTDGDFVTLLKDSMADITGCSNVTFLALDDGMFCSHVDEPLVPVFCHSLVVTPAFFTVGYQWDDAASVAITFTQFCGQGYYLLRIKWHSYYYKL